MSAEPDDLADDDMADDDLDPRDYLLDPDQQFACWCGATGTAAELYDPEVYSQHCGGLRVLHCECGGDLCVCHHHGEVECPGCPDCEPEEGDWFDVGDEDL